MWPATGFLVTVTGVGTYASLLYTPVRSTGFGLADTIALRNTALGTPSGAHLGQTLTP
ncbi:hypothetical protein [Streptomyces carpinensis]|uniref:hypothetical protein n=1 Tax=Streptomyces carpinensis TaxID=66369 RepID=UPI0013024BF1|nr:hypothetical protein [Streptomyces carpinensis]